MTLLAVALAGVVLGLALRRWSPPRFSALFRGQQLVVIGPLAVLSGWAFRWRPHELMVLGAILAAEIVATLVGIALTRGRGNDPVTAVAAGANTTFWSVPVAAALVPAGQVVLLAVYDTLVAARGAVQIRFLRRGSPLVRTRRSAIADFAKPLGLCAGLAAGLLRSAPGWVPVAVVDLGRLSGVVGIAVLVLALPPTLPERASVRRAMPALALRYGFVTAALALLESTGVGVPGVMWVVATAPAPFSTVALARLYGYSREVATACLALTVAVSTALLPVLAVLAR